MAEHAVQESHTINWKEERVVDVQLHYHQRCFLESWLIKTEASTMNRDEGTCPQAYNPLLPPSSCCDSATLSAIHILMFILLHSYCVYLISQLLLSFLTNTTNIHTHMHSVTFPPTLSRHPPPLLFVYISHGALYLSPLTTDEDPGLSQNVW